MQNLPLAQWDTVIRWHEIPGQGPPIVCLPGLSFAVVPNFLPLMMQPEFRGRRVLMVDYIGSGFSGWSDSFSFSLADHAQAIAELLETACDGPTQILGHSMGGTVAIELACSRPELVSKIVVCEGNVTPGGGGASRKLASTDIKTFVTQTHPERMQKLADLSTEGKSFPSFLWAARASADPRGIHGNAKALVDLDEGFQDRFLNLSIARHFVYGAYTLAENNGQPTPDAPDAKTLQSHGVQTHVIAGVGHAMMIDDPVASAAVLGPILASD